jgi:hypothetical protein
METGNSHRFQNRRIPSDKYKPFSAKDYGIGQGVAGGLGDEMVVFFKMVLRQLCT